MRSEALVKRASAVHQCMRAPFVAVLEPVAQGLHVREPQPQRAVLFENLAANLTEGHIPLRTAVAAFRVPISLRRLSCPGETATDEGRESRRCGINAMKLH